MVNHRKIVTYVFDVFFGLILMALAYTYYLHRFRVDLFYDEAIVDGTSSIGQFINFASTFIVGYVAKHSGETAANLVKEIFACIMKLYKLRAESSSSPNSPAATQSSASETSRPPTSPTPNTQDNRSPSSPPHTQTTRSTSSLSTNAATKSAKKNDKSVNKAK